MAVPRRVENQEKEERSEAAAADEDDDGEYEVDDLRDRIKSSIGSRFNLITNELSLDRSERKFSRESFINGLRDLSKGLVIHPDNRSLPHSFHNKLTSSLLDYVINMQHNITETHVTISRSYF